MDNICLELMEVTFHMMVFLSVYSKLTLPVSDIHEEVSLVFHQLQFQINAVDVAYEKSNVEQIKKQIIQRVWAVLLSLSTWGNPHNIMDLPHGVHVLANGCMVTVYLYVQFSCLLL